jgi:hypothetical protein
MFTDIKQESSVKIIRFYRLVFFIAVPMLLWKRNDEGLLSPLQRQAYKHEKVTGKGS